jgi:hypothetical protein
LEVGHAEEGLEVIFQVVKPGPGEVLTEIVIANGYTEDSDTVEDDRHGRRESEITEGGFGEGRGVGHTLFISELALQNLAIEQGPTVVGLDRPLRLAHDVNIIAVR